MNQSCTGKRTGVTTDAAFNPWRGEFFHVPSLWEFLRKKKGSGEYFTKPSNKRQIKLTRGQD